MRTRPEAPLSHFLTLVKLSPFASITYSSNIFYLQVSLGSIMHLLDWAFHITWWFNYIPNMNNYSYLVIKYYAVLTKTYGTNSLLENTKPKSTTHWIEIIIHNYQCNLRFEIYDNVVTVQVLLIFESSKIFLLLKLTRFFLTLTRKVPYR